MPFIFINIFLIFGYFFLFLDPIGVLSYYPSTDNSQWFREDVQRIIYKVFREERMI